MTYKGSCHCGKIAFEVDGELEGAVSCNCSICSRKGALLWAVPREQLRVEASDEDVGQYLFNNHSIVHKFCRTCGMHPFGEDSGSPERPSAYVNVRCLEDIDVTAVPVFEFDGRSA